MSVHKLKILPMYFNAVLDGSKPFEVRKEDDRTYTVGDELLLKEYLTEGYYEETDKAEYTGRFCHRKITYKLKLPDGWCVLGLCKI